MAQQAHQRPQVKSVEQMYHILAAPRHLYMKKIGYV
jgi:hypothetical protein